MQSVLETLSDSDQQSLTKIQSVAGEAFVNGVVYHNYNADENTGLALSLHADAPVVPELMDHNGGTFQYVAVAAIDKVKNPHITSDNYFTQRAAELDALVPQYASPDATPSLAIRNAVKGTDSRVTDVEIGQYGGRVGVYKQVDVGDTENVNYYLVAVGGAQRACEDLQQHVSERINGIDKWGSAYTNTEYHECPKQNYVNFVAKSNVLRMMYNAADAFGIGAHSSLNYNVDIDTTREAYPSEIVADTLQQIAGMYMEGTPHGNVLHMYNGVIPRHQLKQNKPFYVLEGPADPIHVFDSGDTFMKHGVPASTGRVKPLPQSAADVKINDNVVSEYERRCKKVFWEKTDDVDMKHPDVAPDAFNRIQNNKVGREFLEKLEKWGWDKTNTHERLQPVCVKISNPFLLRPEPTATLVKIGSAATPGVPRANAAVVDEFNE